MSTAELRDLRKAVQKHIGHADERVVKMVYALEADAENEKDSFYLTPEQDAELDEIMELDKRGLMEYSSWEEVKARILSKKR